MFNIYIFFKQCIAYRHMFGYVSYVSYASKHSFANFLIKSFFYPINLINNRQIKQNCNMIFSCRPTLENMPFIFFILNYRWRHNMISWLHYKAALSTKTAKTVCQVLIYWSVWSVGWFYRVLGTYEHLKSAVLIYEIMISYHHKAAL